MTYDPNVSAGLYWTGHPLIDMGVAGLTVFAQKRNPEDVSGADLERFVEWAEKAYFTKEMAGWIAVAFTSNFINPSFEAAKKREVAKSILESFKHPNTLEALQCSYFRLSAQQLVARDFVPMLMGRELSNFFPDGQPQLPVSGLGITALQGLSLASPLVGGRLIVVAADDPKLLIYIVRGWQSEIRKRVQLSETSGGKCPGWSGPRSRLIEQIIDIEQLHQRNQDLNLEYTGSVTIYHASNSGQGPELTVYTLELPALSFVRKAQGIKHREGWNRLVSGAWREVVDKDKDAKYARRNDVYEAVFDLPQGSAGFIRRFFLRPVSAQLKSAKPVEAKKPAKESKVETPSPTPAAPPVALWGLLELFLKEVLGMEQSRIQAIRILADRLAGAVKDDNDRRLFQRVYTARKPFEVRQLLIQMGMRRLKKGLEPAVRFDEFLGIFEEGDELARADFGLAWDLTRMRVIETLFDSQWFNGNEKALEEIKDEEEEN
ncbi:MAG: type I-B CRISPR-associated protein Cas8b1/Cst1 [Thermaceae bacterium]|nr:type I-B CRISPR-associated protein Cas8b1/Cst1 [Thermaceae bacterium]